MVNEAQLVDMQENMVENLIDGRLKGGQCNITWDIMKIYALEPQSRLVFGMIG